MKKVEGVITICKKTRLIDAATAIAKKMKWIEPIEKLVYLDELGKPRAWIISVLGKPGVVQYLEYASDDSDLPGLTAWVSKTSGKILEVVLDRKKS